MKNCGADGNFLHGNIDKWILSFYNKISTRRRGPRIGHAALCFLYLQNKERLVRERLVVMQIQ